MNTILLTPTDTLFFRDGRPMDGASSGHGAAWPLPHVINSAFHAALHRASIDGVHAHRVGRSGSYEDTRSHKFGSLVTVGPFPVQSNSDGAELWFFPRPADAQKESSPETSLRPLKGASATSSLQSDLLPVVNTQPPSKEQPEAWMSKQAWDEYLNGGATIAGQHFANDSNISTSEHQIGIGIDPDTDTQNGEQFFSASYLRLQNDWKLGIMAEAQDKINRDASNKRDLIQALLDEDQHILIGGQQRTCSAKIEVDGIPLPTGAQISGTSVRYTLLTPAIFPQIGDHPGGWLPSWISEDHQVQLLDGPGKNKARRLHVKEGKPIQAKLVAAVIPRSISVTGWSLGKHTDEKKHGAKTTHLAVPAGAVYYFEANSVDEAKKLAEALNWHGTTSGSEIVNRRSSLMGEKGFGLGVCSNFKYHQ